MAKPPPNGVAETEYTKSQQGGLTPSSFRTTGGVHELVAGSSAWQVRAAKDRAKIGSFALPAISYYHACEHITRNSRADSCTHCLHAAERELLIGKSLFK